MNGNPIPPTASVAPPHKDRRTGLIVFGVLQMILGGVAALMIPLMILGQVMAARVHQESMGIRHMIAGAAFYAIAAGLLIALGIGSCMSRRWARSLSLVVAWSWLVIGVLSVATTAFLLPSMMKAMPVQGPAPPESVKLVIMVVSLVFMTLFFILVPGALVLFYRSRHVKATCEARNPSPGWTDACPLPVLGLSLWLASGALSMLAFPPMANGVFPAFGMLISGLAGWLCGWLLAGLFGYTAWAVYRLRAVGWWIVVVCVCVMAVSAWVTFSRIDLMEMYRLMGYPEGQIRMMEQISFFQAPRVAYLSVAGAILMLGYLLFVKRYFRPASQLSLPQP